MFSKIFKKRPLVEQQERKLSEEEERLNRFPISEVKKRGRLFVLYHGRKNRVSPDSVFYELTDDGEVW